MKAVLAGARVARPATLGHLTASQAMKASAAIMATPTTRGQNLEGEELLAERGVIPQPCGRSAELERALLQHVDAVGERQRELRVLLGEQDGEPFVSQARDLVSEVIHHDRRQPLRGLVEEQQLRVAHERA